MTGGLIVVGVGRSGTSIATKLAGTLGLRVPPTADLMPGNESNPGGHWESVALAAMNDRLLAEIGSTWWTPPAALTPELLSRLAPLGADARHAFVEVFGTDDGWLWKDPRLTVLLPVWAELVEIGGCLLPFRPPQAIAASLMDRDDLTYTEGLAVWERHTRLVLTACVGWPVAVADYEQLLTDPDGWREDLRDFCARIGLPVHEPRGSAVDEVRRPNRSADGWLSPEQAALVDLLHELRGQHDVFTLPAPLPDESPWVDDVLARLRLPAYVGTAAPGVGLEHMAEIDAARTYQAELLLQLEEAKRRYDDDITVARKYQRDLQRGWDNERAGRLEREQELEDLARALEAEQAARADLEREHVELERQPVVRAVRRIQRAKDRPT